MAGGKRTMNRHQKLAWWNLIVIAVTIIVTSTAVAIEFHTRGYSTIGIWFIVIMGILNYNRYFFRKPQGRDTVICDERDSLIVARATAFAYKAFWIALVVSTVSLHLIIGPRNSVPTITLPLMALAGGFFMKIVGSVAILVQYGRQPK
jgi:hypothetical protein